MSAIPGQPKWLGAEAQAEWRRITPELERLGLLSKLARAILSVYCDAWSNFVAAAELCRQQGLLVEGQKHNPVRNPSWLLFRDAASMVVALGKELGLTPNARGRMRVPEAKESLDDLFD